MSQRLPRAKKVKPYLLDIDIFVRQTVPEVMATAGLTAQAQAVKNLDPIRSEDDVHKALRLLAALAVVNSALATRVLDSMPTELRERAVSRAPGISDVFDALG